MKTQAYVLAEKDAPFKLEEVELAEPEVNEVLVKITACGLCHTDLGIQNGGLPSPYPNVAGHEGSGKVLKVGSAVTRVKEGDSVLLSFAHCLDCGPCKIGYPAACEQFGAVNFGRQRNAQIGSKPGIKGAKGEEMCVPPALLSLSEFCQRLRTLCDNSFGAFFGQSAFAQHAVVVETSVVKVPSDADLVMLAPLGCGLQTGAGAVLNFLKPPKESSISIIGVGAVGCAALFAAVYLGIKTIVVVDLVDKRLELAKSFGATHTFNAKDPEIVKKIKALTPYNMGTEYSVECTGNKAAIMTAWEALANRGHLVSCGTPGPGNPLPFGIFENLLASKVHLILLRPARRAKDEVDLPNRAQTYTGLTEGASNPPESQHVQLYNEGHFPVDKISKTFAMDKLDDACHAMHTGETIKPIIVFNP
ncbi:SPOSA6832_01339, partial [Sporobolomyces salmonicolor]